MLLTSSQPPQLEPEVYEDTRVGERWERRLWRMKRPERVAAVGERRSRSRQGEHRAPQQERVAQ